MKLPRSAYLEKSPVRAARFFLGKWLCVNSPEGVVKGLIYETEAYGGVEDKACHGFGGRRTERTKVMFEPGGIAYVYFTYGMHYLLNFVTGAADEPKAVLIRGVWIMEGAQIARSRRGEKFTHAQLANGPGKVCQAFGIDKSLNAADLTTGERIWVEDTGIRAKPREITTTPRIGIAYAQEWAAKPWRFAWNPDFSSLTRR